MTNISDVNVMNVKGKIEKRETKYCVCICSDYDKDRYFFINTESRKIYDDFQIKSSDYPFLKQKDRYINCSNVQELEKERIIEKKGNLNYKDMKRILNKIRNSNSIRENEKKIIITELEKWLKDDNYAKNKLSAVFRFR